MESLLMPNSQDFDAISDPTLAKLLEVDGDLAAQEAHLMTQLQQLQEKRSSLKIVVSLFTPEETTAPAGAAAASSPLPAETSPEAAVPKTKPSPASTRRSQGKKRATSTPAGSRESWRPYVREEFPAAAALSEIASKVLHRLPERAFSVPELMNAIFVVKISKEADKKARARLSAILLQGVKENKWQRDDKGQYRSTSVAPEIGES